VLCLQGLKRLKKDLKLSKEESTHRYFGIFQNMMEIFRPVAGYKLQKELKISMYTTSSVCSVNYQARALCAQYAAKERHRFLVGTCSLHDSNELNVLQYSEDSNLSGDK
jgi:hypothetical protein